MASRCRVRRFQDEKFVVVSFSEILSLTLQQLLSSNYILRFDVDGQASFYFTEDEAAFSRFEQEAKLVYWLHDLFEHFRKVLTIQGYPCQESVFLLSLSDLRTLKVSLEVFEGSEVEIDREPKLQPQPTFGKWQETLKVRPSLSKRRPSSSKS